MRKYTGTEQVNIEVIASERVEDALRPLGKTSAHDLSDDERTRFVDALDQQLR